MRRFESFKRISIGDGGILVKMLRMCSIAMMFPGFFIIFAQAVNGQTWNKKNPSTRPSARYLHAMAYDSESDRIVLFGGTSGSGETWEYDLNTDTWTQKSPSISPPWRKDHAMAYDSESDRIVLFGGFGSGGPGNPFDDTWEYDLNTDTWVQQFPAVHPSGRYLHAMVYDSESDRIVLFGGESSTGIMDDTWVYDANTHTWSQKLPAVHPSKRQGHSMAYDSESDRVVLFGGWLYPHWFADTWEYDLNTNTWTQKFPSDSPPGRKSSAMVYDSLSDRIVLFGGMDSNVQKLSDTWEYDLNSNVWEKRELTTHPPARWGHAMAYDSESDRTVLFGGTGPLDDTWEYDEPLDVGEKKNLTFGDIKLLSITPNPFRDRVTIRWRIEDGRWKPEDISLKIYDATGRLVKEFIPPTASTVISWDGRDESGRKVRSGVYFLKFEAGDHRTTEKLLLVK